jgi:hypothetical protein
MSVGNVVTQFASGLRLFMVIRSVPIPDDQDFEDLTFVATISDAKPDLGFTKCPPHCGWLLSNDTGHTISALTSRKQNPHQGLHQDCFGEVQIARYGAFVVHFDRQNLADFWSSTRKQPWKRDAANRHGRPVRGVARHSWMLEPGRHTLMSNLTTLQ